MMLNIEQRSGNLIISHINKIGDVEYMKLNVPTSHKFTWLYSKQKGRGNDNVMSWDGKPVYKVPTEFLSRTRIQEFFLEAGDQITKPLFESNMPKGYYCDIEVDVDDDGFPGPGEARNRINAIAWAHYPEVVVFGLKPLSGEQIDTIEKNINEHLRKVGKTYKFIYKQFNNEADMLYDFLYNYARHAPLISGWNFWGFDWRYIYNRCKRLNLDISWMSPTKQWYKHKIMDRGKAVFIMLPQHKLIVDYLEIYKKWDRTVEVKENNTLDFVAESALGIRKVKYPGTFQDLYNKDYDRHCFYVAIDSILVELLNERLKTMATFLGLGNLTRVEAMSAFSPIAMLEATLVRYAYSRGQVFPKSYGNRERDNYEGAFVFEPDPNLYEWVASFDFASLYPTIMRQWKISIENFVKKDKNATPNDHEVKCSSGAIFDVSNEPLLSEILTDYYGKRKVSKKVSFMAEKKANELKEILKERKKNAKDSLTSNNVIERNSAAY